MRHQSGQPLGCRSGQSDVELFGLIADDYDLARLGVKSRKVRSGFQGGAVVLQRPERGATTFAKFRVGGQCSLSQQSGRAGVVSFRLAGITPW